MGKLFISQADYDKKLIDAIEELLVVGVGVPQNRIFRSSPSTINPGVAFDEYIRSELDDAVCELAVITEAYYASAFCMCELGGAWLQTKNIIPLIVPPLKLSDAKAILASRQALRINVEEELDAMSDVLIQLLEIERLPTSKWNAKKIAFLKRLNPLIEEIRFEGPVKREEYAAVVLERNGYRDEVVALQQEIDRLESLNAELMAQKDQRAVAKVVAKHSSEIDNFKRLARAARDAVSGLGSPVFEALFMRSHGEDGYRPGEYDEDPTSYVQEGQLSLDREEGVFYLVEHDADIAAAIGAVDELAAFLSKAKRDFLEWYRAEYDGERPKIELRPFWRRHLGLR